MSNNTPKLSAIISYGLVIFSMFFGAGNLMYPILVGMESAQKNALGIAAFMITAVLLPLAGLMSMILFQGDYKAFFHRLGTRMGNVMIFISMLIIGPALVIPRIVTLSHTMIAPFIPLSFLQDTHNVIAATIFSFIFLFITFLATYRESKIVQLLGDIISPILVVSLVIIIVKGFISPGYTCATSLSNIQIFTRNIMRGYETLDLLGAIFFSSIFLHLLKQTRVPYSLYQQVLIGLQSGLIGVGILGMIYIGLSYLGVFHGFGLEDANAGELFREVSFRVLGTYGAIIIATAVLMACLSTAIALAAVLSEYVRATIFQNRISYLGALMVVLVLSLPLSLFGLETVLKLTAGPLTYVGYPVLIALTACNIAYKLFYFTPVKVPVFITFIVATISYLYW